MNTQNLIKELHFKATRSSGAGGQHVNKVSSKIVLSFDVSNSNELTDKQQELLCKNLATRLTKEQVLILSCDDSRSQHQNKTLVIQRFLAMIKTALIRPKKRKATRPSKASVRKKAENKRKQAFKKSMRKKPGFD
ncbi:MAG: alternative ribosome rescue aminoacyl-tRNA hydrolase ArfB [Polaribacter sp.]|nr:alternative ribosome rescue aminoacyl-tRNA hydrolase ArfB [Polaribacter sp.]